MGPINRKKRKKNDKTAQLRIIATVKVDTIDASINCCCYIGASNNIYS